LEIEIDLNNRLESQKLIFGRRELKRFNKLFSKKISFDKEVDVNN